MHVEPTVAPGHHAARALPALPPARPTRLAVVGGPVVELRRVTRTWRAGGEGCHARVRALAGVDLAFAPAEIVAVAGPPGAGKTTLLLCAAGLARPDSGLVLGASPGRVAYVGPGDDEWARRALLAAERGARAVLLDVLDGEAARAGRACAAPRAVAAVAGSLAGRGIAVVVAAREVAMLPAFAHRLVRLAGGRVVGEERAPARRATVAGPRAR